MVSLQHNASNTLTASHFFCERRHSHLSRRKSQSSRDLHVVIYAEGDQLESCSRDPIGYWDGPNAYAGYFLPASIDPYGLWRGPWDPRDPRKDPFHPGPRPPGYPDLPDGEGDPVGAIEGMICVAFVVFDVATVPSGEGALGPACAAVVGATIRKCFKKKAKKVLECEFLHRSYKQAQFDAGGCTQTTTCVSAVKKSAAKATEVALRQRYLAKRCDYILPGSIAAGSARKEAQHRQELLNATARLARCSAHAARICKNECCD